MKNIETVRRLLKENQRLKCRICKATGLDGSKLALKLYDVKKITVGEMVAIKSVLGLTIDETIKIFAPFVAKYNEEGVNG